MIRKVVIKNFKRFKKVEFDLPGHVVLAGPNNTGKTTLLQAIAAWSLAFDRWKQLNGFHRHGGAYTKAPIARQAFSAVPLRAFDLLWNERKYRDRPPIEIEIHSAEGWKITIELIPDSTEQIYVRPKPDADPDMLRKASLQTVYVPPMTGLGTDEPVYRRPKIDQLLGQGKPGDILRNLLVEAHQSEDAWPALTDCIRRLFGYEVLPPDATGADIIAEYKTKSGGPPLDIASAGSGFQQVLMLLTFLHTRPASVLLIDEPDAHLHVILQDAIYGELRSVALKQDSQLILATHSEVIINAVDLRELYVLFNQPRRLTDIAERKALSESLKHLTNTDIMLALGAPGILYVEDYTDIDILREWAKTLNHPAHETLTTKLFWKKVVSQPRDGAPGINAKDHYEILKLVKPDLPGLVLIDGDARPEILSTPISGSGLQRQRWRRYEIESYLVHPAAIAEFIKEKVGPVAAGEHIQAATEYFEKQLAGVLEDPLGDHLILEALKASERILPEILNKAGIPNFEKRRYYEIAAVMKPEEIHPEVREKLDAIQQAFGL